MWASVIKTTSLICVHKRAYHFTGGTMGSMAIAGLVPAASVRVIAVFASPIPPELTADTFMTYMVKTVRLVKVYIYIYKL